MRNKILLATIIGIGVTMITACSRDEDKTPDDTTVTTPTTVEPTTTAAPVTTQNMTTTTTTFVPLYGCKICACSSDTQAFLW